MRGKWSTDMGEIIMNRMSLPNMQELRQLSASVCRNGICKCQRRVKASQKGGKCRQGVNISIVDNKIKIELHIIVAYGVSIRAVFTECYWNVKYKIERIYRYGCWIHKCHWRCSYIIDELSRYKEEQKVALKSSRCSIDTENVLSGAKALKQKKRV